MNAMNKLDSKGEKSSEVTLKNIILAKKRINDFVENIPLNKCDRLSKQYDANIYVKREDLQKVRSYKIRGAYNLISSLTEKEKKKGVVCASAGNHAQGVAFSCNNLQIKGVIFVPVVTPKQKIDKINNFGNGWIELRTKGADFDEASKFAQGYCNENDMTFVHPFDDARTICGQGTIGLEIYEELKNIDYIFVPIGGGGLISGISTYFKEMNSNTKIIGVEPKGAASMNNSIKKGKVVSLSKVNNFVDGCAVKKVGDLSYAITSKNVKEFIKIDEGNVAKTMIDLYQNEGIITEPGGALSISALDYVDVKGKTVVCIISGGNNDISRYPEIVEKSLVFQGLKHYFIVEFAQAPGQLKNFLDNVLGPNDDISRFEYIKKTNKERGPSLVGIELANKNDYEPLIKRMKDQGIKYKVVDSNDPLYSMLI